MTRPMQGSPNIHIFAHTTPKDTDLKPAQKVMFQPTQRKNRGTCATARKAEIALCKDQRQYHWAPCQRQNGYVVQNMGTKMQAFKGYPQNNTAKAFISKKGHSSLGVGHASSHVSDPKMLGTLLRREDSISNPCMRNKKTCSLAGAQ